MGVNNVSIIDKVGVRRTLSLLLFHINKAMFSSGPLVLMTIFCISGVLQPTIVQFLTLNGAFDKSTLLIVLPNYMGMSLAVLTRYEVVYTTLQYVIWTDMAILAGIDILSQGLCLIGLVYAGSSIYIIVYSSTTIWAAVWSYFLLQKYLNIRQWLSVVVVVAGLGITALDTKSSGNGSGSGGVGDAVVGIVMILLGSFTHALTWVLIEKWTSQKKCQAESASERDSRSGTVSGTRVSEWHSGSEEKSPPSVAAPELVCSLMGIFGCVFYSIWQVVYTIPRWDELVTAPIAAKGGNEWHICIAFMLLAFMGFLHAVSFYHLLGHVGSVATGVLKGVQSVAVLVLSHEAFCAIESSQCFNVYKGVSLVVVLSGVYFYSVSTEKSLNSSTSLSVEDSRHRYVPIYDLEKDFVDVSSKELTLEMI